MALLCSPNGKDLDVNGKVPVWPMAFCPLLEARVLLSVQSTKNDKNCLSAHLKASPILGFDFAGLDLDCFQSPSLGFGLLFLKKSKCGLDWIGEKKNQLGFGLVSVSWGLDLDCIFEGEISPFLFARVFTRAASHHHHAGRSLRAPATSSGFAPGPQAIATWRCFLICLP